MFSLDPRLAFGGYFERETINAFVLFCPRFLGAKKDTEIKSFPPKTNSEAETRVQGNHFPAGVKGQRPLWGSGQSPYN
jgi:hypothetical protein